MRSNVLKTDLDKSLPNIQEIQTALVKLRQICVIGEQSHSLLLPSAFLFAHHNSNLNKKGLALTNVLIIDVSES